MAKIYLRGQEKPIITSRPNAMGVQLAIRNPEKKTVMIEDNEVRTSQILRIDLSDETPHAVASGEYDIRIPEQKEKIKEFEKEFDDQKTAELKHPLNYFGYDRTAEKIVKVGQQEFKIEANPRRVYNPVIGLLDAGVVQHLMDINAIKWCGEDHWAVTDIDKYQDFRAKQRALMILKGIKDQAKRSEQASLDKEAEARGLVEASDKLSKTKDVETCSIKEPFDIDVDQIPC